MKKFALLLAALLLMTTVLPPAAMGRTRLPALPSPAAQPPVPKLPGRNPPSPQTLATGTTPW